MEILIIFLVILFLCFLPYFCFLHYLARIGKKNNDNTNSCCIKSYDDRLNEITSENRGTQSERDLIRSLLDYGISPRAIFHDLIIKNGKNKSAQIDIVVATKVGLIVFEVKDYSGWIFGKGKQNKWTQVFSYGDIDVLISIDFIILCCKMNRT